jgi:hypothetical protein
MIVAKTAQNIVLTYPSRLHLTGYEEGVRLKTKKRATGRCFPLSGGSTPWAIRVCN